MHRLQWTVVGLIDILIHIIGEGLILYLFTWVFAWLYMSARMTSAAPNTIFNRPVAGTVLLWLYHWCTILWSV